MHAPIDDLLLKDLADIIAQGKKQLVSQVNSVLTLTYWHVGKRVNEYVLHNGRAAYGKEIVVTVARQLVADYGKSFEERNLRRMMQFATVFPDFQIVTSLMSQLSWTHFIELFPLKTIEERMFYAQKIATERWSVRQTKFQIERKAFERNEIANIQAHLALQDVKDIFKDPYFLDFLGLKDGYLENDLESAIIKEIELFILELGVMRARLENRKNLLS